MKMARQNTADTSKIVPCLTAVKLNRVVLYNKSTTTLSVNPRFKWLSENSNGLDNKLPTGSDQLSRTVLTPNGRAAMWSNTVSTSTTLTEILFEYENFSSIVMDIYFDYVESAGVNVTYNATGMSANALGIVYPPLDCFIETGLTVGTWNCDPVVPDDQRLSTIKPTTFSR